MEMTFTPVFLLVYGALQVGLVMPLIQWIKRQVERVFTAEPPISPVLISYLVSFGVAYGLCQLLDPTQSIESMVWLAFGGSAVSQTTHAVVKTINHG